MFRLGTVNRPLSNGIDRRTIERLRSSTSFSGDLPMKIVSAMLTMLCLLPVTSSAEVATATPTGFLVKRELAVAAPPAKVFEAVSPQDASLRWQLSRELPSNGGGSILAIGNYNVYPICLVFH